MMQIKTRHYGGPSRRAVIAYNIAFFAMLLAAFGVALVCLNPFVGLLRVYDSSLIIPTLNYQSHAVSSQMQE